MSAGPEARTREWIRAKHNRLLPSMRELLAILIFTRSRGRSPNERALLARATMLHGLRLLASGGLIIALTLIAAVMLPKPRSQAEWQAIFFDPSAGATERVEAFERIPINDINLFPRVIETLRKTEDPAVVRHALPAVADVARKGASAEVRASVESLTHDLLRHRSPEVRSDAFRLYAANVSSEAALKSIRWALQEVRESASQVQISYIAALALAAHPRSERSGVLRELLLIVRDQRDTANLAAAVTAVLNGIEPSVLIDWLIAAAADDPSTFRTPLEDDLVRPYLSSARPGRVDSLASEILARVVLRSAASDYGPETVFLVQTLGRVSAANSQINPESIAVVTDFIQNRDQLESSELLEVAIEAFSLMNRDGSVPSDMLGDVLATSDVESQFVMVEALRAVGRLGHFASLPAVEDIALARRPATASLRTAALEALQMLGKRAQSAAMTDVTAADVLPRIRDVFAHFVRERASESPDYVQLAIGGLLRLGDDAQIELALAGLLDSTHQTATILDIQEIAATDPDRTEAIVRTYLRWRSMTGAAPNRGLTVHPDMALIGFGFYRKGDADDAERGLKNVLQALATIAAIDLDPSVRRLATDLLQAPLTAVHAPRLPPEADAEERHAWLERWRDWWTRNEGRLVLIGDLLVPPPEAK